MNSEQEETIRCHSSCTAPPAMRIDPAKAYSGTLETNKGTIQVEFYPEDAPSDGEQLRVSC